MALAIKVFWVLAALLAVQSLIALRDGFRFLEFFRRRRLVPSGDFTPHAAVIIPCKGLEAEFAQNLQAFLTQDYPPFQLVFTVDSEQDPAHAVLSENLRGRPRTRLVVAGKAKDQGQKVHNLVQSLAVVDPAAEVLVFADIDARPAPDWLRSLVAQLADPTVTVSTGFRWYLPRTGFASRLRAAWDTSIATLLGEHRSNLAWGGSMAIRAADFRRLQIAERYWQGTVSDDYALARAVRESNGRVAFEPRCLVASREESSLAELLRWMNRQIIITRIYAPRLWRLGIAAHALYALTMVAGGALILAPGLSGTARLAIAATLLLIEILGVAKGGIRAIVAREGFKEEHSSCYWALAPLVPWVMLYNFLVAGFSRRIEWRGTVYNLNSDREVRIVSRKTD